MASTPGNASISISENTTLIRTGLKELDRFVRVRSLNDVATCVLDHADRAHADDVLIFYD